MFLICTWCLAQCDMFYQLKNVSVYTNHIHINARGPDNRFNKNAIYNEITQHCLEFVNLLLPVIKAMHSRHVGSISFKYSPAQMCCNCWPVSYIYILWSKPVHNHHVWKVIMLCTNVYVYIVLTIVIINLYHTLSISFKKYFAFWCIK